MGVVVKKVLIAISLIASLTLMSPAHAGDKSGSTKAMKLSCKNSYAVGHAPKQLAIPTIKKPFKDKTFTLKTNCGDVVFSAFGTKAPLTVISMSYMANNGYFDETLCHRLTTKGIYVLQCGDPTASGSGGPTWQVPDENLPTPSVNTYPAGTIAMANSGPNTNGSQFFIVYSDNSMLRPNYTVWGQITKGLDIIRAVAAKGSNNSNGDGDGVPNQTFALEKVTAK